MMMAENPKITVEVEAKGVQQAKSQTNDLKEALKTLAANSTLTSLRLQQIAEQTKKVESETNKAQKATSVFSKAMEGLKQVVVAYFSLNTVKYIMRTADQMRMLEARTINASKSIALGVQNFKELKRIAGEAGVALEGTVQVFQRVANTKNSIGATNAELLKMTETVSKLGVLSGASGEAIKNSQLQFSQAMAGGIVRAEEFNSVMENTPELAIAIAEGLGVSIGELRRMVLEGKLLSKDVFDVLVKKADEVNEKFEKMPMTFGRLKAQADITFGTLIADIDKATGASNFWVKALNRVLNMVDANKDAIIFLAKATAYAFKSVIDIVQGAWRVFQGVINSIVETTLRAVSKIGQALNSISPVKFAPTVILEGMIQSSKKARKENFAGAGQDFKSITQGFANLSRPSRVPQTIIPPDVQGTLETPATKSKNKKSGSGKSEAEKELDRYKDALKTLKDKAREAMLEVQGMDKAINALASGGIKAYEAQVKQNEGLGRYNELMGDYLGKGKQELELIAQRIVKQEQDAEAKKKQLELSVQLAEVQRDLNFEEEKAKQLRDAFIAGGERAYELKKRELEIEERRRQLLGNGDATEEQKRKAQEIADREDVVKRNNELLDKQVSQAKEAGDAIRNALRSAFDNTIEHMVNGTSSFKEIMVGLLRQIAVQLIKVYALQLLTGFIGGRMTGGSSAGANAGVFDKIGGAFGISPVSSSGKPTGGFGFGDFLKPNPQVNQLGRATGGAVSANVPYVVGEAGREMFVPRSAGNIIPNYAMPKSGGGGAITVVNNMTINTQEGDDKNSIMEAGKALSAMMETKVRQILQVESRQGGMLHRSFA